MKQLRSRARAYVQRVLNERVLRLTYAGRFSRLGIEGEDVVFSVKTTSKEEPDIWIVGGSTPMCRHSKSHWRTAKGAFEQHRYSFPNRIRAALDRPATDLEYVPTSKYDAFICHASEDKSSFVRPLAVALRRFGLRIWYDEFSLKLGDSLRQSIDRGLADSQYGIVVLSKPFFAKNWPQYELNGLTARELETGKVVLPVWHGVSKRDVLAFSPPLADKVAVTTHGKRVRQVAEALTRVIREERT